MKNPLNKRILQELKQDFGKYFVIFAFLVLLIGLVSGFLVASDSMLAAYDEGIDEYKVENGHITFDKEINEELMASFTQGGYVSLYELFYKNVTDDAGKKIRIYKPRNEVNLACVMKGHLPETANEIAIDRLFAQNNKYKVGDIMSIHGKPYVISGFVSLPDYCCLYEDKSDMMFNASNFSIAIMTEEGFDSFSDVSTKYNYAWLYGRKIDRNDDKYNKECAEVFLSDVRQVLTEYNTKQLQDNHPENVVSVTDYLPQYMNQAINFAREDIGKDSAIFLVFAYLVIALICFVFAVTIANTIQAEASVIGTLRASGYTRGELVRHYMILPIVVTLFGALVGNILGYSVIKDAMADLYYNSYSLPTFETIWNANAFLKTTVIPIIMMFVINTTVLVHKLKLSPIRFLRNDLSKRGKKKAFRLNTKIPFMNRFRIRVLFQNIPNYITLFLGIFLGGVIVIFSLMFGPMIEDYKTLVLEQRISDYQYIVTDTGAVTANEQAEKYCLAELKTTNDKYVEEEVSIYGFSKTSAYSPARVEDGKTIISSAYAKKYDLKKGDFVELLDTYEGKTYSFEVSGVCEYDAGIAIFLTQESFNEIFGKQEEYFSGYVSNEPLNDIDGSRIAKIINVSDLTKASDQLMDSMGSFMNILKVFGVIMFLLLMYLLSKQIIEKNSKSIAMAKILGFYNGEIGSIYIVATSLVVVLSMLITCPLVGIAINFIFEKLLYTMMTGYIPYIVSVTCYIQMIVLGIACYAVIAALQMRKINKINKTDVLKIVE